MYLLMFIRLYATLTYQPCTCHMPALFKTIPGYLLVAKEVGIKTRELELLRFIIT